MASQLIFAGIARVVQVMPSGEVALALEFDTATNRPVPLAVIADHDCGDGILRCVHVIPSGEVTAISLGNPPTAAKTVPFQAIAVHELETGRTRCVHVIPSGEVATIFGP